MEFEPNIVYEDNHLLVVIKPHNVAVQEDESKDDDLLNLLKNYIKTRDNKPGNVYLGLVHRLDRPTGGVMVFAKTSKAASRLTEQLKKHEMRKTYLCITYGKIDKKSSRLQAYLKKDEKTNTVNICTASDYGAKEALLDYEVLAFNNGYSLVAVSLITGRSHQIRVQMSKQLKSVILGDFKYGDKTHKCNLALWAYKLTFKHPTTKKQMEFVCSPDIDVLPWKAFKNNIEKII